MGMTLPTLAQAPRRRQVGSFLAVPTNSCRSADGSRRMTAVVRSGREAVPRCNAAYADNAMAGSGTAIALLNGLYCG